MMLKNRRNRFMRSRIELGRSQRNSLRRLKEHAFVPIRGGNFWGWNWLWGARDCSFGFIGNVRGVEQIGDWR